MRIEAFPCNLWYEILGGRLMLNVAKLLLMEGINTCTRVVRTTASNKTDLIVDIHALEFPYDICQVQVPRYLGRLYLLTNPTWPRWVDPS